MDTAADIPSGRLQLPRTIVICDMLDVVGGEDGGRAMVSDAVADRAEQEVIRNLALYMYILYT